MEGFIIRGEWNMKKMYSSVSFKAKNFELDKCNFIDILYKLFETKIDEVSQYLLNKNVDPEEWDISFVKTNSKDLIKEIKTKFCDIQELNWRSYMDKSIDELIRKYEDNFLSIDKYIHDKQDKYEQYFDILCNMFANVDEILNIEYKASNENKRHDSIFVDRIPNLSWNIFKNNAILVKLTNKKEEKNNNLSIAA